MADGVSDERKVLALTQGWGWPGNSKKAHYFIAGAIQSMCRKWAYAGERTDDLHNSPDGWHRPVVTPCGHDRRGTDAKARLPDARRGT